MYAAISVAFYYMILSIRPICFSSLSLDRFPPPDLGLVKLVSKISKRLRTSLSCHLMKSSNETVAKKPPPPPRPFTAFFPGPSATHLHHSPHFYTRCPSCRNHSSSSWLGTRTGICWIAYPRGLVAQVAEKALR